MKRSLKYGVNTLLTIVLVLGIMVITVLYSFSHHKRFDLTEEKKYTLSEQSVNILRSLKNDVTVYVFFEKGSNFLEPVSYTHLTLPTIYSV